MPCLRVAWRTCGIEPGHVVNYSIDFYALQLLIANMKYTDTNYKADMKKVGEDPETQRWWDAGQSS